MSWWRRLFGGERVEDPPRGDPERIREVEAVLASLRPAFRADGGDVRLLAVEDGTVRVRLVGACGSCQASQLTLQGALAPKLREACGWFRELRAV